MTLLFTALVVLGFLFRFLATYPVNYADRIAWGCWLAAAIIWAVLRVG